MAATSITACVYTNSFRVISQVKFYTTFVPSGLYFEMNKTAEHSRQGVGAGSGPRYNGRLSSVPFNAEF